MDTATVSTFFAILALVCIAAVIGVVIGAVLWRGAERPAWLVASRHQVGAGALWLAAAVASVATAGSLYYSEVVGFVPCPLCWYQRIAMYPLALLLWVAAVRGDVGVRWYAGPLAAVGAAVASYHTWVQANPDSSSPLCTLDNPCGVRHVWEFGFVSLPVMALAGFGFVLAMLAVAEPAGSGGRADMGAGDRHNEPHPDHQEHR
ncbi:MAG: disulfide bond formation protein B [Acidimicrobiia bacterium]|nr:disulfide bond formation protein B [Acidimicrobiia bacterium]